MKILKIVYANDDGGVLQAEIQYVKELLLQNVDVDLIIVGEGRNKELYSKLVKKSEFVPGIEDFNLAGNFMKKGLKLLELHKWAQSVFVSIKEKIEFKRYSVISFGRLSLVFLANKLAKPNKNFLLLVYALRH